MAWHSGDGSIVISPENQLPQSLFGDLDFDGTYEQWECLAFDAVPLPQGQVAVNPLMDYDMDGDVDWDDLNHLPGGPPNGCP